MAVAPRPTPRKDKDRGQDKKKAREKDVQRFIKAGGAPPAAGDDGEYAKFLLRLPKTVLAAVDEAWKESPKHSNRTQYVVELLVERMQQEGRL